MLLTTGDAAWQVHGPVLLCADIAGGFGVEGEHGVCAHLVDAVLELAVCSEEHAARRRRRWRRGEGIGWEKETVAPLPCL